MEYISTPRGSMSLLYTTAQTAALAALALSADAPTAGLLKVLANAIRFAICGAGADNATITGDVIGWDRDPISGLYAPAELLVFSATLGQTVGIAGNTYLPETVRFADAISITASRGLAGSSLVQEVTPAANGIKWIVLDALDCEYVQLRVAPGTATNANALVSSF